jgi:hypothetical protein
MKILLKVLALAGLVLLLTASVASAQVVQPSYVRPSKGAALTIAPSITASSVVATYTTSAIFDWSAFAGVVVTANASATTGTYTACRYGVRVQALGGTSTNSADFFLLNVANNDYRAALSQSWYVRVLPGYLRFVVGTYDANTAGQPSCTYKLTVTPLPFDYAGLLVSTGVSSSTATGGGEFPPTTVAFSPTYPYTRIQNLGGSNAICTPVNEDGTYPPWSANWPIVLAPIGDYPNVIEVTNWVGAFKCVGSVGIFQH